MQITQNTTQNIIITIDGPAASGKSSVAKALAENLGFAFISSGLLYRAIAYLALKDNIVIQSEDTLLKHLEKQTLKLYPNPKNDNQIYLNNENITSYLHTDVIDKIVSTIAKYPTIRTWINKKLQEITGGFVIEGRDMGSTVFPNANYKFYLIASLEIRAKRRLNEREANLALVSEALLERDIKDAKQLEPAKDAIHIDTNKLNLQEVVRKILAYI